MPFKDKSKKLEYARELYQKHREVMIQRVRQNKRRVKKWIDKYKETLKCSKCGESHPSTIDFHHKNRDTKEVSVAYLVANGYSTKRIEKELEKCEVLCANCHRKLHYKTAIFKRH